MSEVPYWLQPFDAPAQKDLVFNIPISTSPPPGLNYQSDDVGSLWETVSSGAESVVSNIKESVSGTYRDALGFVKEEISDLGSLALNGVDSTLGTLSKYFVLILGGLVLLIYVAGKSGLITAVIKVFT